MRDGADKSIIMWKMESDEPTSVVGHPQKALKGHGHFVTDVVMSSDGQFALSGSWDKTLRLWDLNAGTTTRRFVAHTKDVLSVAFSADNRQIVSGSRDKSIKLWNTLAQCKYTVTVRLPLSLPCPLFPLLFIHTLPSPVPPVGGASSVGCRPNPRTSA